MTWTIEFTDKAQKHFDKLDSVNQKRIMKYVVTRLAPSENPIELGKPLSGDLAGHVRYRIGDYRLIARIEEDKLVILIVGVGHRRLVYD